MALFAKPSFCLNTKVLLSSLLLSQFGLVACSHKHIDRTASYQTYHAPAQAYNLNVNNPAIFGSPMLKSSCSVAGSSLEIKDKIGQYYKIDVINLLANQNIDVKQNKKQFLTSILSYYNNLYKIDAQSTPTMKALNTTDSYMTMTLNKQPANSPNASKDTKKQNNQKPVLGLLVTQQDDFVFVIQHIQNRYDQKQMVTSLKTIHNNMRIPGSFAFNSTERYKKSTENDKKSGFLDEKELLGFIKIDPSSASASDIEAWKKKAKC